MHKLLLDLNDAELETLIGIAKGAVTTTPKEHHYDEVYKVFKNMDTALEPLGAAHFGAEWNDVKKQIIEAANSSAGMLKKNN